MVESLEGNVGYQRKVVTKLTIDHAHANLQQQMRTVRVYAQAPLKQRYRDDPAALITLNAEGRLGDGVKCSVATARAEYEI